MYKRIKILIAGIIFLLVLPLIAMQYTTEVSWTSFDFFVATILLTSFAIVFEFFMRIIKARTWRIISAVIIGFCLVMVWVLLATG